MTFPSPAIMAATRRRETTTYPAYASPWISPPEPGDDGAASFCYRWPRGDAGAPWPGPTPPESPRRPSGVDLARALAIDRAWVYGEIGWLPEPRPSSPLEVKLHDSDWVEP